MFIIILTLILEKSPTNESDLSILLFKNGVIIKKWHHNDIPTIDEINELLK